MRTYGLYLAVAIGLTVLLLIVCVLKGTSPGGTRQLLQFSRERKRGRRNR
jgi:heme exporter protein D